MFLAQHYLFCNKELPGGSPGSSFHICPQTILYPSPNPPKINSKKETGKKPVSKNFSCIRLGNGAFYELSIPTIFGPAAVARNNLVSVATSGATFIGVVASTGIVCGRLRSRSRFRRRAFYKLSIPTVFSPAAVARNNLVSVSTSGTTLIGVVASASVVVTTTCVPASSRGRATCRTASRTTGRTAGITTACSTASSGNGTTCRTTTGATSGAGITSIGRRTGSRLGNSNGVLCFQTMILDSNSSRAGRNALHSESGVAFSGAGNGSDALISHRVLHSFATAEAASSGEVYTLTLAL